MTAHQAEEIRKIVQAGGWDAIRRDRPDLWSAELQRRREAKAWVDANIDCDNQHPRTSWR
jgi:hypothetical protein